MPRNHCFQLILGLEPATFKEKLVWWCPRYRFKVKCFSVMKRFHVCGTLTKKNTASGPLFSSFRQESFLCCTFFDARAEKGLKFWERTYSPDTELANNI